MLEYAYIGIFADILRVISSLVYLKEWGWLRNTIRRASARAKQLRRFRLTTSRVLVRRSHIIINILSYWDGHLGTSYLSFDYELGSIWQSHPDTNILRQGSMARRHLQTR